ncbi:MAG: DUF4124 domain-containing protein [Betaproteobacteria bacterium]
MNRMCLVGCAFATLALAPGARADVYKCAGEGGGPVYQEMPCAKGRELRNFQTDPPEITILPALPRAPTPAEKSAAAADARAAKDAKTAKDARPGKSVLSGDASERKFLRTGMSEAEVMAKLGQPDMTTGGKNGGAARWTYMPAPGDSETITSMTITKGTVTDIERKAVRK